MIAVGIGLHNLGEGLAIGAAYAVGAATLGTFLVVGFIIQNITEGLGHRPDLERYAHDSLASATRLDWRRASSCGCMGSAASFIRSHYRCVVPGNRRRCRFPGCIRNWAGR